MHNTATLGSVKEHPRALQVREATAGKLQRVAQFNPRSECMAADRAWRSRAMSSSARQCRTLAPVLHGQPRQPLGPVQSPPERGEGRRAAVAPALGPKARMHLTIAIFVRTCCVPGFCWVTFWLLFGYFFVTFS
jgi:hypothetical protein